MVSIIYGDAFYRRVVCVPSLYAVALRLCRCLLLRRVARHTALLMLLLLCRVMAPWLPSARHRLWLCLHPHARHPRVVTHCSRPHTRTAAQRMRLASVSLPRSLTCCGVALSGCLLRPRHARVRHRCVLCQPRPHCALCRSARRCICAARARLCCPTGSHQ